MALALKGPQNPWAVEHRDRWCRDHDAHLFLLPRNDRSGQSSPRACSRFKASPVVSDSRIESFHLEVRDV